MDMKNQIQKSLENQYQEMKAEREAKEARQILYVKILFLVLEIILSIAGIWILVVHLGWWTLLGLWLISWSNNLSILRQVGEGNKYMNFWKKGRW